MKGFRLGPTIVFVVHRAPFIVEVAVLTVCLERDRLAKEMVERCTIRGGNKPLNASEAKSQG